MDFFTQNLPVTLALPTNLRPGSNFLRTDGKPVGACELMFQSTGGYPMATKASGILVFIIEKQYCMLHVASCVAHYLPWSFSFDASPTQPPHGPLWARLAHAPEWWFVHV